MINLQMAPNISCVVKLVILHFFPASGNDGWAQYLVVIHDIKCKIIPHTTTLYSNNGHRTGNVCLCVSTSLTSEVALLAREAAHGERHSCVITAFKHCT